MILVHTHSMFLELVTDPCFLLTKQMEIQINTCHINFLNYVAPFFWSVIICAQLQRLILSRI